MLKKLLLAALLSLPLAAGAVTAYAAPEGDEPAARPPERERVVGLVESERGQVLTVQTRERGTVDVHWTAETACLIDVEEASCEGIEPGFGLLAVGTFAGDSNQFHATRIHARLFERPEPTRVSGVVVRDEGTMLAVETREQGIVIVQWTDETRCVTGDRENQQEFDCVRIAVEDRIGAAGRLEGDTLVARTIGLLPKPVDLTRVSGTVTANHGRVLAVETREGETFNVHWDADTKCATREGEIACDAIEVGSRVFAAGTELGGNNLDAKRIVAASPVDRDGRPDLGGSDLRPSSDGGGARGLDRGRPGSDGDGGAEA